ncbi:MAG: LCP family protein [Candidatus Muiribacteriota bacterium]
MNKEIKSKKNNLLILIVALILLSGIAGYYYFFDSDEENSNLTSLSGTEDLGKFVILVLGTDKDEKGKSRSDTMMLVFVNTYTKQIQIISIPRDTKVHLEEKGRRKINAAYVYHGIEGTKDTVENLLKVDINHYVTVDLDGFINLIDILGGIQIDVQEDMYYVDKAGELYIDIEKGKQTLDGRQAMHYVRYRDRIYADIGRIERQQKFIKKVLNKAKEIGIIWKIPAIIQELYQNIETDMGISELLNIGKRFRAFDFSEVKIDMLPGEPKYIEKISYYVMDEEATKKMIEDVMNYENKNELEEEKVDEVQAEEEIKPVEGPSGGN